jgi:hypothetical protein
MEEVFQRAAFGLFTTGYFFHATNLVSDIRKPEQGSEGSIQALTLEDINDKLVRDRAFQ